MSAISTKSQYEILRRKRSCMDHLYSYVRMMEAVAEQYPLLLEELVEEHKALVKKAWDMFEEELSAMKMLAEMNYPQQAAGYQPQSQRLRDNSKRSKLRGIRPSEIEFNG